MTLDRQLLARTLGELQATLPQDGDLLVGLGRVVEATRTVVGVDGTGLTLAHEDGRPRWVAVSDAAMELLEQVQHDSVRALPGRLRRGPGGGGPGLTQRAGLGPARRGGRPAAGAGVLSVPVRLADQPVGTLDVYATRPRVWTPTEVEALGALAVVTAELVSTGVELANREVEVAQLRQALANRVWIEQAKGVLAATRGLVLTRRSSSSADGPGRPRASWPTWPRRSSRRPSASGSPPWPSTTPGSGRPRRGPGRPSRRCRPARPGWPDAPPPWTGPKTTSMNGSGPPTNATTSPTNASATPTRATRRTRPDSE